MLGSRDGGMRTEINIKEHNYGFLDVKSIGN